MIDLHGKTRLNLGSGKSTVQFPDFRKTYFNVDVKQWDGTDLVFDMRDLEFEPETFTEILVSDCLDHVNFTEAKVLLRKIVSWLKPNGLLRIHTPNLRFLASVLSDRDNHEVLKWLYGSDGEGSTNYSSNLIRWCYSKESLSYLVKVQGLTITDIHEDCGGFAFVLVAKK